MRRHTLFALLACIATTALSAPPAWAEPPSGQSALLRGAHFSPDTPSVDVYLTSFAGGTTKLALSNVGYGDVSDYKPIDPGMYTVGMRPAGADPSTPVAISWTLDAKPGQAFTACAIGMHDALQGRVLSDDLSAPLAGQTRVRIIQAASRAPTADIVATNGPVIGKGVPFGTTANYTTVAAGSWPVTARSTDNSPLSTTTNVTLGAGRVSTLVLLDAKGPGISMRVLEDAVGQDRPPQGPVAAGAGSTFAAASNPLHTAGVVLTVLALATTVGLLGFTLRRRVSTR